VRLDYQSQVLDNGLDVIVHEDHRCPIVAINIWYHVGSKNERRGRTGFAHLFEHLMFEGSAHHDRGYFHPLLEAGAALNASTNADRTNYWEVVPLGALELALWMESDRMGFLLPALTPERFGSQRDVVLNERRQNYENRPYGLAGMALVSALYPPDHPYHWLTIGQPEDLRAASLDEVHAFLRAYYHPRNASLVMAGDLDPARAFALAREYFGDIEPGPEGAPVSAPAPAIDAEIRLMMTDRVELPRLYLGWHTPPLFAPGDAELDLVADFIGNGKTSRLYRSLVYERRIATDVAASQNSRELSSFFQVVITAAPGRSLSEIDQVLTGEISAWQDRGPTPDEMARGLVQAEAHFIQRLQTVGGFGGKSDQLNAYNVFLSDPGYFNRDFDRYQNAAADDLMSAARRYLRPQRRVALSVVPTGRADLGLAGSSPVGSA